MNNMTPKQKAQELVDKYHYQICNDNGISENDSTEFCAKQCAIIAVDEILETGCSNCYLPAFRYWTSVKTEIENL